MSNDASSSKIIRCAKCFCENPAGTMQCISCGKVILAQYDHLIPIATIALLFAGNLMASSVFGVPPRSQLLSELAFQSLPAIAVATLLINVRRKLQTPSTHLVRNLTAQYSDASGRLLVLGLVALLVWMLFSFLDVSRRAALPIHKVALFGLSICIGIAYLGLYFGYLRGAFFSLSARDAITVTADARVQYTRNRFLKKVTRIAAINELQGQRTALDVSFFARGYANEFGMTSEQGEQALRSLNASDFALFVKACKNEIRKLAAAGRQ